MSGLRGSLVILEQTVIILCTGSSYTVEADGVNPAGDGAGDDAVSSGSRKWRDVPADTKGLHCL